MIRSIRTTAVLTLGLLLLAVPAVAHDDDHDHADAIIWDGTATEDCSVADPGTIVWELTESDDLGYVELHIDEPVEQVLSVDGPPHTWITELYPLDEIEADADRIHGEPGEGAALLATYCPDGRLPHTGVPVIGLLLLAAGLMGAGALALRRVR